MLLSEPRPLRLVVTGRGGQIVRSLLERGPGQGVEVLALGRPELDLSQPETVASAIERAKPDIVLNAAAYTAVDKAESDAGLALEINAAGAGAVAAAAARCHVPVVQISTDYVFDGTGNRAFREEDPTGPLGAYGRSKLAGEQAVAAATSNHVILRTAWVYSPFGTNFVKTMLRLAATRDEIPVVDDQHGCPTNALDMADGLLAVVRNLVERPEDVDLRGIFHMAGTGETTWAAFAQAIFAASSAAGGPSAAVKPIASADFPTPARRPANSRLDCGKLARTHGVRLPTWDGSVNACVVRLLEESAS